MLCSMHRAQLLCSLKLSPVVYIVGFEKCAWGLCKFKCMLYNDSVNGIKTSAHLHYSYDTLIFYEKSKTEVVAGSCYVI